MYHLNSCYADISFAGYDMYTPLCIGSFLSKSVSLLVLTLFFLQNTFSEKVCTGISQQHHEITLFSKTTLIRVVPRGPGITITKDRSVR